MFTTYRIDAVKTTPFKILRKKKRKRFMKPLDISHVHTFDEELEFEVQSNSQNPILLGTYSTHEWISASVRKHLLSQKKNIANKKGRWLTPILDLVDLVNSLDVSFAFNNATEVLIFKDTNHPDVDGLVGIDFGNGKIDVDITGTVEWIAYWFNRLDGLFKRAESLIEWVYGSHGETMSLPLNYRAAINAAYPWLGMSVDDFIDSYLTSDASVLVLIGPPGTGKCLDPNEEIELLVSDEIFEKLQSMM